MKGIISLKNVSFATQNIRIIHDVTLEIDEGKTTALVGASGSGKSTLLKLCAGLLIPSGGQVYFRGKEIGAMNRAQTMDFRRESAFVFQDSALWANQSLEQSLDLPLRLHFPLMSKKDRSEKIRAAVKTAGYQRGLGIRPSGLSTGEQKLVGFARALILDPRVLFLDEWTESLDDRAAQRLVALVKERKKNNNTIVFVSHRIGVIRALADFVILVVGGRAYLKLTAKEIDEDNEIADLVEQGLL
ncbi:MAG: ABC transporter ATP-binding protein [Treponema sp.]|jgi:ABC-type methionine transport system ATPase subunit|nr:ABC transporter ATP-binding protein [Treponema sp.]